MIRKTALGALALALLTLAAIPAAAGQAVEMAKDEFGGIDIVVNNAAILRDDLLFKVNPDDWDTVIRSNLSAAFYLLRAATPIMRDQAS